MPRNLSDRDIQLLQQLAPEFDGEVCNGSGCPYRSILPPVANHYAKDRADFEKRVYKLDKEDVRYLVSLIETGEESLHCISPDYYDILEKRIAVLLGDEVARKVSSQYAISCD